MILCIHIYIYLMTLVLMGCFFVHIHGTSLWYSWDLTGSISGIMIPRIAIFVVDIYEIILIVWGYPLVNCPITMENHHF